MNARRRPGILYPAGLLAGLAMAAVLAGAVGAEERSIGEVTSVVGEATAQQPDGEARTLACGDPIYEGDRVVTAKTGRVGVMMGDTLAHLSEGSELLVAHTPAETADVTLERGKVRVIDPRQDGAPARLAALDVSAELAGTDTEAYVFAEKLGPYAMLCEWDAPLVVVRPGERAVASPGDCVISKKTEPLYTAKAHEERIPALAEQVCDVDPALLAALAGSPADHLTPADVSAAGPAPSDSAGFGEFDPTVGGVAMRVSCDEPGTCGAATPSFGFEPQPAGGPAPSGF
jgi:hypothetical protein